MKPKHTTRLLLSLLLLIPFTLFAQDKQDRKDKLETMHIAYITQKLDLTPEEAQKFWPVYNQYKAAMEELRKQRMDNIESVKKAGGMDNMSEEDVKKLIAAETDIETKQLDIRKEYVTKFQNVIPIRKVAKFFVAEDGFKRYLLNQLKQRRERNGRNSEDDDMGPR